MANEKHEIKTEHERNAEGAAAIREIRREEWREFLDSFSRQHEGWLVSVAVATDRGQLVETENRPLVGITADHADGRDRVYIQVGGRPDEHVTHVITEPTHIRFRSAAGGAHEGLDIVAADGTTTVLRFRAPARPETLDGLAA